MSNHIMAQPLNAILGLFDNAFDTVWLFVGREDRCYNRPFGDRQSGTDRSNNLVNHRLGSPYYQFVDVDTAHVCGRSLTFWAYHLGSN